VIGDANGLERSLGAELLRTESRPIPLQESVIDASGHAQHLNPDGSSSTEDFVVPDWGVGGEGSKHIIIPLVRRLVGENKKVIVFRVTKGETVGTARYLAQSLGLLPANSSPVRAAGWRPVDRLALAAGRPHGRRWFS
jgi:helicase